MLDRLLGTSTFRAAATALDGLAARHAAISDNIANVNTPGYKRKDVVFEEALARALDDCGRSPCGGRLPAIEPRLVRETGTSLRADGNNVDIDREAVALADNALRYQTLAQYVGGFFAGLKSVINSGR